MTKRENIEIFVSCHKDTDYVKNGIFKPIQVGTGLAGHKKIEGFFHDNNGENISDKNLRFCELTAQYWVWKNKRELDYVGFFHYRRYLSFKTNIKDKPDMWGSLVEPFLNDNAIIKYGWDEDNITRVVEQYDIVLPEPRDIRLMPKMGKNMRQQYYSGDGFLHEKDLDIMLEVLEEKYPEFLPDARKYLEGHMTYLNNMFIMKREIFDTYSKWLFDILFECDKRINYDDYSIEAMRTPGHLAERLLNIYIMHIASSGKYRIKELPTVFLLDTTPLQEIKPAFDNNNIALVFSANDYYSPYLATVMTSVIENSSRKYNYDVLVMHKDISEHNQRRLNSLIKEYENFSLRFINMTRFENVFKPLFLRGHFTVETWFRLMLPNILKKYNKVLYLDSDLVANADVAELYNTDMKGYLLAACHDPDTAGLYNGFEPNKKQYMDNVLRLQNPYKYFQAGVILFNLAEFRKNFKVEKMLQLAGERNWELLDQDVLNYLAQGKVKFVDMSWNVMYDWRFMRKDKIIGLAPKYLQDEYRIARMDPKIIHYAGPDKPWDDPEVDFADEFWKYCKKSGYYEIVIYRMVDKERQGRRRNIILRAGKKVAKKVFPERTQRGQLARSAYAKMREKIKEAK